MKLMGGRVRVRVRTLRTHVVRRVHEEGIIKLRRLVEEGDDPLHHVVHRAEHRPAPLEVNIGHVRVLLVEVDDLAEQVVLVELAGHVEGGQPGRLHARVGLLVLGGRGVGSMAGGCAHHHEERILALGHVLQELE